MGLSQPAFSLQAACLFLVNTAMRPVPTLATRRCSPGSVSAFFPCLPLPIHAFHAADAAGKLAAWVVLGAFPPGLPWQTLPAGPVFLRSARSGS